MSKLRKNSSYVKRLLRVVAGSVVLSTFGESAVAQMSEIDSYDRAVTSQSKENALAFINEFRSSHLLGDLIESLQSDVAREVCADLPSGVPKARRACEKMREALAARPAAGSDTSAGAGPGVLPPTPATAGGTHSGAAIATQTQPSATQAVITEKPASTPTGVPQVAATAISAGKVARVPKATESIAPTQMASASGFRIQVLSERSRTAAEQGWWQLLEAYPDLLRDLDVEIQQVDLGAEKGGIWYRAVAGPIASREEATMLCIVIRSHPPHDCFVAGR